MSTEQKPEKSIALENRRVPAQLSHLAQQLCGRVPANMERVLEICGRIPSENALLAQSVKSAQQPTPVVNNALPIISAAEKPAIGSSSEKPISPTAGKASD